MRKVLQIPHSAEDVIEQYQSLEIAGRSITAPYFMNKRRQRGGLRVLVGKGSPEEIEREVKVLAQLKGFDLKRATGGQLREFMQDRDIGIDCSGFVVHVVDAWLDAQDQTRFIDHLKFKDNSLLARLRRALRPVESIGADMLTNERNTDKISDLNLIKPGDLIRMKGRFKNSHHVLLITKVVVENEIVKEFEYVHSNEESGSDSGVSCGRVIITDPGGGLKEQQWIEDGSEGLRNFTYENLLKEYEDNGVRRLKHIRLKYIEVEQE